MKPNRSLLLALPIIAAGLTAAEPAPAPKSFADALAQGRVTLNARLRHESVQQTALRDADALTLRTRLGYSTAPLQGWKLTLEAENTTAADGDSYSQAGLNPGGAGRAVVADPEGTEVNQAFVTFAQGKTTLHLGRQRLVLDNARFIGDVGWRQNQQTFDAVTLVNKDLAKTTLTYAYLDRVQRVFGARHAQGRWRSDSHVFNASYTGLPTGTLTAYAYLLQFDNSAANSTATYGLSFAGSAKLAETLKLSYRAEFATQSDYRNSPLSYRADYHALELGLVAKQGGVSLLNEQLGSDNNTGFKTPLATLHAFNGWADLFLATPAAGLRDTYLKANANLPGDLALVIGEHWYETDAGGTDLGREFNASLTRKFGKFVTATAKYADYQRDSLAFPDVRKFWLQLEYVY
jgi:hypothetical protein